MPRLPKGSEEARKRMAHLRSLRKKKVGGSIEPVTPTTVAEPPKEKEPETTTGAGVKTKWVQHVQAFAKKHGLTYFAALKNPDVKVGYTKK